MKSKVFRELLRWLIVLLGAGLGMALLMGVVHLSTLFRPEWSFSLGMLIAAYMGAALIFGLIFYFLSNPIIDLCIKFCAVLDKRLDNMPMEQIISCTFGLIAGLLIAALLSQVLTFLGESMFTTAFSAILYVLLGVTGFSLGLKRTGDIAPYLTQRPALRSRGKHRKDEHTTRAKVLDTSCLIDGRVFDVCKAGFLEGDVLVPSLILEELRRIADSTDSVRRSRGRRGLDVLNRLQTELHIPVRFDDVDYDDLADVDAKLLRYAQEMDCALVTVDYNLSKVASVTGVHVLNLNELASALRPAVVTGEELTVQIVKEGKEPTQGVAYMDDGTMIVVEGGRRLLGESALVTVTTVLQTNAGRMVFAKVK